jgi:hypothetical protein
MSELIESVTAEGLFVHQIFYDEASRASIDPGFIPLDNTANPRPDWYEFWVILDFLRRTELSENAWYGFLSPRFFSKVGLTSDNVYRLLRANPDADVLLLPYAWNITCYSINQFEMGERSHPGLLKVSEPIFDRLGYDIRRIISHMGNSNYSNFIVGKPSYWRRWQRAAEALFETAESTELGSMSTTYVHRQQSAPMKAFIQERIGSVIMFHEQLDIVAPDVSETAPFIGTLLKPNDEVRRTLRNLDLMKRRAIALKDGRVIEEFRRRRSLLYRSWAT